MRHTIKKERTPLLFILIYADESSPNKYLIMLFDAKQRLSVKSKFMRHTTKSLTLANIKQFDRLFSGYILTKNTQIALTKNVLLESPIWIYLSTICKYIDATLYNISFDNANNGICKSYPFLKKRKISGLYKRGLSRFHNKLSLDLLWDNMCQHNICPWINIKKTNEINYLFSTAASRNRIKKAYLCLYFMFIRKHKSTQRAIYKNRYNKNSKNV